MANQSKMILLMVNLIITICISLNHSTKQWWINNKTTFIHSAVEIRESTGKGQGLFVTKDVSFGEVLIVERPLIAGEDEATSLRKQIATLSAIQQGEYGINAQNVIENLAVNENFRTEVAQRAVAEFGFTPDDETNLLKYYTNSINGCLYGLASKMNHGYPTTVDMLSNEDNRIIVFATDDLTNGTELVWDYFCLLYEEATSFPEIFLIAQRHSIQLLQIDPFIGDNKNFFTQLLFNNIRRLKQVITETHNVDNLVGIIASNKLNLLYRNGFCLPLIGLFIANRDSTFGDFLMDYFCQYSSKIEKGIPIQDERKIQIYEEIIDNIFEIVHSLELQALPNFVGSEFIQFMNQSSNRH